MDTSMAGISFAFRITRPNGITVPTARRPVRNVTTPTTVAFAASTWRVTGAPPAGSRRYSAVANRTATTSTMSRATVRPVSVRSTGRPPSVPVSPMSPVPVPVAVIVPLVSTTVSDALWCFAQSVRFISPMASLLQPRGEAVPFRLTWSKTPPACVKRQPPRRLCRDSTGVASDVMAVVVLHPHAVAAGEHQRRVGGPLTDTVLDDVVTPSVGCPTRCSPLLSAIFLVRVDRGRVAQGPQALARRAGGEALAARELRSVCLSGETRATTREGSVSTDDSKKPSPAAPTQPSHCTSRSCSASTRRPLSATRTDSARGLLEGAAEQQLR
ncbi:hypothetical protein ABZX75_25060 [Streptomyces sp. NPDC003038]|uniref:hypothetical protein n=1 Tax=unclassified Streptomyces TaxID=2593676 RepID=UPI0033B6A7FF